MAGTMITIPASVYAMCDDVRVLGEYVCFSDYCMVRRDLLMVTPKQSAMIEAGTSRSAATIGEDTATLLRVIDEGLQSNLRGLEGTNELREVGGPDVGYTLGRVCVQLSGAWNGGIIGMDDRYFRSLVRKPDFRPWQALNSPLSPILVGLDNVRPRKLGFVDVAAVIMPFLMRR